MESIVKTRMEGMKFGEIQIHNHVAVIPMISNGDLGPDYLTMKEALDGQFLMVAEIIAMRARRSSVPPSCMRTR